VKRRCVLLLLLALSGLQLGYCAVGQTTPTAAAPVQQRPRNVAILIFDGVIIIDYTGPYETFGHVYAYNQPNPFNIYTVGEKQTTITTAFGMSVNPTYSTDTAPKADTLVVPGGVVRSVTGNAKVMQWLKDQSQQAEIVMSVCNGAFILAQAGLLDNLGATTTAGLIEQLRLVAPKATVVADKRFVDNGKIITTAGLTSGIDGTLHVIERLYGRGTAEAAALAMEYNWNPDSTYARAALADKYLPNQFDIETLATSWVPLSRAGTTDHWESKWTLTCHAPPLLCWKPSMVHFCEVTISLVSGTSNGPINQSTNLPIGHRAIGNSRMNTGIHGMVPSASILWPGSGTRMCWM